MTEAAKPERKPFKDWFDPAAARALAAQVRGAWSRFDAAAFQRRATKGLAKLEFAGRVQQFSDALAAGLPDDIPRALGILTKSLPPVLPNCDAVTDGWLQWPVGQFVADHGVPHFEPSMVAMTELTQRFSSEFAVRPFVEQCPEPTFARLMSLTTHASPHVRRWCSEGVRTRLPWGKKLRALVDDPSPIWPILEALEDDDELYVRRSVANNLGDIAKDHPDAAVAWAKRCAARGGAGRTWLVKHGLRTLIKAGDPGALAVVGFGPAKKLDATLKVSPRKISIGDSVELSAQLQTSFSRAQELMVDYVVHYVRKGGKSSGKVFKWKTTRLPARGRVDLQKKHAMKTTTIRALYPGRHTVELQVNGARVAEAAFTLQE